MSKPLRLLLVEDREDDALLVLRHLRQGGYDVHCERVETADAMRAALGASAWDVVISDYSMPHFGGPDALRVLKESGLDIPFIITSGTIGEEAAVEVLRAGSGDFILKTRLARLIPAIERELEDAAARRAARAAEEDLRRLEAQVAHAQKMEAVGRVAGGVAHDFNNVLTAILATADLALTEGDVSATVRKDLESIRESAKRAAAITRQLLMFSRKQVVQTRPLDVNEVLRGVEPMLRRLVPTGVELRIDAGSTGIVEADPTQMEQILVNLVVNAVDAMPDGGTLAVSTADFDNPLTSRVQGRTLHPGSYVVLRVKDTGTGIDEATLTRIFEPFFTTKAPGKGTGLGLATVQGIVEQTGGHVLVHSRPGEGTMFEICLPRTAMEAELVPRTLEHRPATGTEVILVVEDETEVRAPICRALRQLGYYVIEATNGENALSVLHDHHAPVHLVVTDVMMPKMSGAELLTLLHAWYPNLKAMFVSGYSEETLKVSDISLSGIRYLAKPFTTHELARAVRELLDMPERQKVA